MRLCDKIIQIPVITDELIEEVESLVPEKMRDVMRQGKSATNKDFDRAFKQYPPEERQGVINALNIYSSRARDMFDRSQWLDISSGEKEFEAAKKFLPLAHRFFLTEEFISTPLFKLTSPKSLARAYEHFRLPYDHCWFEWRNTFTDVEPVSSLQVGCAMEQQGEKISCVLLVNLHADGKKNKQPIFCCTVIFDPETVDISEEGFAIDFETNAKGLKDKDKLVGHMLGLACDAIIRINSPHITEIVPADLSKINKKRRKKGNVELYDHSVVNLSRIVREGLHHGGQAPGDGKRLHWRRGHFKVRKTGVFWWNPHTAGREELGEVKSDYKA